LFSSSSPQALFLYANQQFSGESELDTAAHQHAGSYSRFNLDAWYTNAKWLGASAFFEATLYPFGRVTTVGAASTFPHLFAGMEYDWHTVLSRDVSLLRPDLATLAFRRSNSLWWWRP
jgi:hypothetical protein